MEIVLRVLQVFLALGLIGVVLLQRSEGGGLGIGSSGGMGSFMSVRGTANFLTRVTAVLAGLFMAVCLILALLAKPATAPKSIFDTPAPTPAPLTQVPAPVSPSETPTPPVAPAPAATTPATSPAVPVAPTPTPTVDPTMKKTPQTGTAPKSGQ
jgi:preprotein translocase subunit SecG